MTKALLNGVRLSNPYPTAVRAINAFSTASVQIAVNPGYAGRSDTRTQEKEVADLCELDRILMMDVRWQVEHVVRAVMQPEKINLASFGNRVLPFEFLRGHSPSAEVRGHGRGQEVLQTGKRNVEITAIEPVGH